MKRIKKQLQDLDTMFVIGLLFSLIGLCGLYVLLILLLIS